MRSGSRFWMKCEGRNSSRRTAGKVGPLGSSFLATSGCGMIISVIRTAMMRRVVSPTLTRSIRERPLTRLGSFSRRSTMLTRIASDSGFVSGWGRIWIWGTMFAVDSGLPRGTAIPRPLPIRVLGWRVAVRAVSSASMRCGWTVRI